jgi:anti-sigma factor RsiW
MSPQQSFCRQADKWVQSYLDGELDDTKVEGLEAHLAECEKCRRSVGRMRRGEEAVRELYQEDLRGAEPSPEFWTNLSSRLERKDSSRRIRFWESIAPILPNWRVMAPVGAFVAILAVWGVGQQEIEDPYVDGDGQSILIQEKRELAQIRASLVDMEAELNSFDGVR